MNNGNNKKLPLELYIHIPFCARKCAYCDFLSGPAGSSRQEAYFGALSKEIAAVEEGRGRTVTSVFIGGGTPSLPKAAFISRLMEQLNKRFHIAPDAEITIEANPGTLSVEKLKSYRESGIRRLSLGLQSPREEELKLLGRIHTFQDFLEGFDMARKWGFDNINVDLMFALPEQSFAQWEENLRTVAALGPEHISAYSLIVEEGTPFAQRELALPDEETEYRMYEETAGILEEYGFHQYEISNYAKEGRECSHNKGYWERRDYLGLGLGAASLYGRKRFSNTRDMELYLENSAFPGKIREEEPLLARKDEMEEFMFLGLRMCRGVSREDFARSFGMGIEMVYGDILNKYKGLGLLEERDGRIFLTRAGLHVSNTVMADFLLD